MLLNVSAISLLNYLCLLTSLCQQLPCFREPNLVLMACLYQHIQIDLINNFPFMYCKYMQHKEVNTIPAIACYNHCVV